MSERYSTRLLDVVPTIPKGNTHPRLINQAEQVLREQRTREVESKEIILLLLYQELAETTNVEEIIALKDQIATLERDINEWRNWFDQELD